MKLPRNEALRILRAIKREGAYQTYHFEKRAKQRNFTMEDVFEIAENGVIPKWCPTYNSKYDDWTYSITGRDIDGNQRRIVFCITSDRRVLLITGYNK